MSVKNVANCVLTRRRVDSQIFADADGQRHADGHGTDEPDERRLHRPLQVERPSPPLVER